MIELTLRGETFADVLKEVNAMAGLHSHQAPYGGKLAENTIVNSREDIHEEAVNENVYNDQALVSTVSEAVKKKATRKKAIKKDKKSTGESPDSSAPVEASADAPASTNAAIADPNIVEGSTVTVSKDEVQPTKDDVHAALQLMVSNKGLAMARSLLSEFDCEGLSALYEKPECWGAFVAKAGV